MEYFRRTQNRVFGWGMAGRPIAVNMRVALAQRRVSTASALETAPPPVVVRKTFPEAWLWETIFEDR